MNLSESKSNLARLMSEENILVEVRNGVSSAFFDTESRLLVIPKFKEDISKDILDLFISHECSHCLNTPQKWFEVCEKKNLNKSILNVVEDGRIERIIKNKYPGLKPIYFRAYKELMNMDFFGLSKIEEMSELNLVDRINLHCKVGFISFIEFNEEEQKLVSKVESAQTFNDAVKVALEIQEYVKKELEQKYEDNLDIQYQLAPDETGSGDIIDVDLPEPQKGKSLDGNEQVSEGKEESEKGFEDGDEYGSESEYGYNSLEEMIEDNLKSITQEFLEEKQKELYSESTKTSLYVDLPPVSFENYVDDYKEIYTKLNNWFSTGYSFDKTKFNKFKAENASIVSYLVKEFNLKKNAQGRKKTKISKTGDINLNKLYSYKTSDDIFKRSSIVPNEQSHGLVFFLDWSASMTSYINDTIKQLLTMLLFCKKQNIPFEVYAFSTRYYNSTKSSVRKFGNNELHLDGFHLMNLFSSRMNNNEFVNAANCLLDFDGYVFGDRYGSYGFLPDWFGLGNTPLNHSILVSKKIVEEFQSRTRVQIVNSIYLTDGESHNVQFNTIHKNGYEYKYSLGTHYYNVYLRDKETKESLMIKPHNNVKETNDCVSFVKKISNFRMFAFRLCNSREMKRSFYNYFGYDETFNANNKIFNKDNCLEAKNSAFDKFYFVRTNLLETEEKLSEDFQSKTISNMSKEFGKVFGSKINNRIFLNKFIEFIS